MTPAAVVSITIDNLGEAAAVGDGTWPADKPLGSHYTVSVVERLIELLDRHSLQATFFVEALNAEIYADALRGIVEQGHELACHGWEHERWSLLSVETEREILLRSTQTLRALPAEVVGFRPPGGRLTERTLGLLAELDYRYVSPAGSRPGFAEGVAVIPFDWRLTDAYYRVPAFAGLRRRRGEPAEPPGSGALLETIDTSLRSCAGRREQRTLVFHPLLLGEPEQLDVFTQALAAVRSLVDSGVLTCLPMCDAAAAMRRSPDALAEAPDLDESSWQVAANS